MNCNAGASRGGRRDAERVGRPSAHGGITAHPKERLKFVDGEDQCAASCSSTRKAVLRVSALPREMQCSSAQSQFRPTRFPYPCRTSNLPPAVAVAVARSVAIALVLSGADRRQISIRCIRPMITVYD